MPRSAPRGAPKPPVSRDAEDRAGPPKNNSEYNCVCFLWKQDESFMRPGVKAPSHLSFPEGSRTGWRIHLNLEAALPGGRLGTEVTAPRAQCPLGGGPLPVEAVLPGGRLGTEVTAPRAQCPLGGDPLPGASWPGASQVFSWVRPSVLSVACNQMIIWQASNLSLSKC